MVPTFTSNRSTSEVPSFTPAASPRLRRRPSPWPPGRLPIVDPKVTRPRTARAGTHRNQPISAGFELVGLLRGVKRWFLAYTFSSR